MRFPTAIQVLWDYTTLTQQTSLPYTLCSLLSALYLTFASWFYALCSLNLASCTLVYIHYNLPFSVYPLPLILSTMYPWILTLDSQYLTLDSRSLNYCFLLSDSFLFLLDSCYLLSTFFFLLSSLKYCNFGSTCQASEDINLKTLEAVAWRFELGIKE